MSSSRASTDGARTAATAAQTAATAAQTAATAAQPGSAVGPALTGAILERYTLQRRLGSGAFGSVWQARDEHLQRDVAVKILARELVSDGRFDREARAAARLSHPGIVTLYEAAVDSDGAYLVSELVAGATLDRLLADGALSDRDILRIGLALCDALEHAHSHGVVHRDVKPSNVLVPSAGADRRPAGRGQPAKLTDFGVARVIDADSLTMTGDVIGTLNYMAPEQAAGLETSEPADLYSLAVVLYEALTGINPLRSGGSAPSQRRARPSVLPPLRRQRRDLPAALGDGIDRALRPQAGERGSIADLRLGLERSLQQVGDEPGLVTDWTLRRSADGETEPLFWPRASATATAVREPERQPRRAATAPAAPRTAPPFEPDPSRVFWQRRALAAICAAVTAGWIGAHLLSPSPLPLLALGLIAGGATLALPRLGWLATICFSCALVAIQGHDGTALVLALAAAIPIAAMPLTPAAWPLPAAAPALGLVGPAGLAGAWPALAGLAASAWRRAALAVSGWLWLLAAALVARPRVLVGRPLYLPNPRGLPAREVWSNSLQDAVRQLPSPYVHTGVLLGAAAWGVAALLVPYVVRGRTVVGDALRALVWSVLTVVAMAIAVTVVVHGTAGVLHGSARLPSTAAELVGAAAGALVLIGVSAVRVRQSDPRFRGA